MSFPGHPTSEVPAGTSAPLQFGSETSILIGVQSTASDTQTYNLALYDCPSVAAYQAAPTAYKKMYNAVNLTGGQVLDLTINGRGYALKYGIVAVPSGLANADGGWLVIFE